MLTINKIKILTRGMFFKKSLLLSLSCSLLLAPLTTEAAGGSNYTVNGALGTLSNAVNIGFANAANQVLLGSAATSANNINISAGSSTNPYYLFGGLHATGSGSALANSNIIDMTGGHIELDATDPLYSGSLFGGLTHNSGDGSATANSNIINISGNSTVDGSIYAGMSYSTTASATANNNTINFNDGNASNIDSKVFAGYSNTQNALSTASGNRLNIASGSIGSNIGIGAGFASTYDGQAVSSSNITSMSGGSLSGGGTSAALLSGGLYGGSARASYALGNATANDNTLYLLGGTLVDASLVGGSALLIFDGAADTGGGVATANNNSIIMSSGAVTGISDIYGGWARVHDGAGSAFSQNNNVLLTGGSLSDGGSVYGGWVRVSSLRAADGTAIAAGNTVTVDGATINDNGSIYGGYARGYNGTVSADNNTANLISGSVSGSVYGAWAESDLSADPALPTAKLTANNNTANVSGTVGGGVYTGYAVSYDDGISVTTIGNTTNINSGSSIAGNVYSAYAYGVTGSVEANNNILNLRGGEIGGIVVGGRARVSTGQALADNNIINIYAGVVHGNIHGGYARVANAIGSAVASNNTVNINGGTIDGNVYGAYAMSSVSGATIQAINNTVNITAPAEFAAGSIIYGGYAIHISTPQLDFTNTIAGNTLNVATTSIRVGGIANFEHYNFLLPNASEQTLLSSATSVALSGNSSAWQSNINLSGVAGSQPLAAGYKVTLLNNVDPNNNSFKINGQTFDTTNNTIKNVKQGHSLVYDFTLGLNGSELQANLSKIQVSENAAILSSARIAGLSLLTQSGDFVAISALNNAQTAASANTTTEFAPFAATSLSATRQNLGSHIDMSGISLLTGFSRQIGSIMTAYFIESGWGSYKTYDRYEGAQIVGNGHGNYYGLGMLVKKDLANQYYTDASLRLGWISTGYNNPDLQKSSGSSAAYNTGFAYYSAHIGIGKKFQLTKNNELDIFTRYLFAHQNANEVNIAGDQFKFDALNSHRVQLGAKYSIGAHSKTSYHAALIYEHEFAAAADTTVHDYSVPTAGIKGASGILDLGVRILAGKSENTTVNLGLQGYIGKRQGIAGNIQVKFGF